MDFTELLHNLAFLELETPLKAIKEPSMAAHTEIPQGHEFKAA